MPGLNKIGPGILLAALAALAACGDSPEQQPPTKIVNPFHDQLTALPADLQRITALRALRDNGRRCRRVDNMEYQRDYGSMALWVALCEDDRLWGIFIAPNGDTQVRLCSEMEQVRLPQCRPITRPAAASASTPAPAPSPAAAPAGPR